MVRKLEANRLANSKTRKAVREHENMGPVDIARSNQATTYRTSITPATGQPERHEFDDPVDRVQSRDKCSRLTAMTRARQEAPAAYADYQAFQAGTSTADQTARRLGKRRHRPMK
jgi:hypothetical protein